MIVRRARASDADWICGALREFSSFMDTRIPVYGEETQVRRRVWSLVSDHVVFVAERAGAPIGLIAGTFGPHPLNPSIKVLAELFWWVSPAARRSRAAVLLFRAFEKLGRAEADWVVLSLLPGKSPVRPRTLERRGFRHSESAYLLEV